MKTAKTYLITGATGYIGSMLIRFLLQTEEQDNIRSYIVAPVRNMQKALRLFPEGVEFLQMDLCDAGCAEQLAKAAGNVDYIIHCASITASAEMTAHPVEVTQSIVNTAQNVLEYARRCRPESIVYLSSMEVYGSIGCAEGERVREDDVSRGKVQILNTRSCYPLGKRMAESICYSYYKEYGVPVKIVRLAQTFGEGVDAGDQRVFSQFARAVESGEDIVLHTKGASMGNYCGIHDAISGIMTVLKNGADGEAYNVVNEENTMTIRQMAELVAAKIAGGKIKIVYDIPDENRYGYAADTGLKLSGEKLMALGWRPTESLEDMYRQMI